MQTVPLFIGLVMLGACAAPKLVTPKIERASYAELVKTQPDCTPFLDELEAEAQPTHEAVLAALWCYRGVWKFWEEEYRVLDGKIGAMEGEGEDKER